MKPSREEQYIEFCFPVDKHNPQRQKLPSYYLPNGAIKLCPIKNYSGQFYTDKTQFYIMDKNISIDVDTLEDLQKAEKYLKQRSEVCRNLSF